MEDHAVGIELQLNELVEERERARVQGRTARAEELTIEIEALQSELAATAELVATEHFAPPDIAEEETVPEGGAERERT